MKLFSKGTYNFIYWLIHKPFGILAIRSYTFQKGGKIANFNLGDDLNFYMLRDLSRKEVMNFSDMRKFRLQIKNFTCIGSIFEWCVDSSSIVWGTGSMYGGGRNLPRPKKICAVRGPLTRKVLLEKGIPCPEVYGDPALLLPLAYRPQVGKKYKLGLIPHYIDYELDSVNAFSEKYKGDVHLIRMQGYKDWREVINEICSCEYIVSSSLHGLIISDAYNIPNVWIQLSDNITGGDFKYHDYFASVERQEKAPLDFRNVDIDLNKIQNRLKWSHPIHISLSLLVDACPFMTEKRKRKLKKDIPQCYPKALW